MGIERVPAARQIVEHGDRRLAGFRIEQRFGARPCQERLLVARQVAAAELLLEQLEPAEGEAGRTEQAVRHRAQHDRHEAQDVRVVDRRDLGPVEGRLQRAGLDDVERARERDDSPHRRRHRLRADDSVDARLETGRQRHAGGRDQEHVVSEPREAVVVGGMGERGGGREPFGCDVGPRRVEGAERRLHQHARAHDAVRRVRGGLAVGIGERLVRRERLIEAPVQPQQHPARGGRDDTEVAVRVVDLIEKGLGLAPVGLRDAAGVIHARHVENGTRERDAQRRIRIAGHGLLEPRPGARDVDLAEQPPVTGEETGARAGQLGDDGPTVVGLAVRQQPSRELGDVGIDLLDLHLALHARGERDTQIRAQLDRVLLEVLHEESRLQYVVERGAHDLVAPPHAEQRAPRHRADPRGHERGAPSVRTEDSGGGGSGEVR